MPANLKNGTIIKSRYQILGELGEGGFAHVYRARDVELGRDVAIKVLRIQPFDSDDDLRRFQREARILAQLSHPRIAAIYAFDLLESKEPFIAMELLQGQSLANCLAKSGGLEAHFVLDIFKQITTGLSAIHKAGIVHRDLSPSNIFLTGEEATPQIKLIDFGLSKHLNSETAKLTQAGHLMGNPSYMSPEMARADAVDERSDIYALGCIIYECLTGNAPFTADNAIGLLYKQQNEYPAAPVLSRSDAETAIDLNAILLRCMQKDPAKRFQNCDEVLNDLSAESSAGSGKHNLDSWSDPVVQEKSWLRSRFVLTVLLSGLALALAGILSFFLLSKVKQAQVKPGIVATRKNKADAELERRIQALAKQEKIHGTKTAAYARALNDLGSQLESSGNYAEAAKYFEKCIKAKMELHDEISAARICCWQLADCYNLLGRRKDGLKARRIAVQIASRVAPGSPFQAHAAVALAGCLVGDGKFAEANELLAEIEKMTGKLALEVGETEELLEIQNGILFTKGELARSKNDCMAAEEQYLKILNERSILHFSSLRFMTALIDLYIIEGRLAEAEILCRTMVPMEEDSDQRRANVFRYFLCLQATVFERQGRLEESERLCDELIIANRTAFDNKEGETTILKLQASLKLKQGKLADAEKLLMKATKNYPLRTDITLLELFAKLSEKRGDFKKAENYVNRALVLNEETLSYPAIANSCLLLARLDEAQGNYSSAEKYCRRSLSLRKKAFGSEQPVIAENIEMLSSLCAAQGKTKEANSLKQEAQVIRTKLAKRKPRFVI